MAAQLEDVGYGLFSINQLVLQEGNCLNPSRKNLDWFHGSRMEGFLSTLPPYNVCANPMWAPPAQDSSWGKLEGRFMTPQGLNYLELCKAILSQVSPSLPPRLKKANTKECGVQVNAKVDKIVQCSLGPKTLFCLEGDHSVYSKSPKSPEVFKPEMKALFNTPPMSNLRFLRPVSIYSPVFDRRIFKKKLDDESEGEAEAAEQAECEKDDETDHSGEDTAKDLKTTFHRSSKGSNFQFLEQRYGFFHCKKCNIRWESAYVWCISGTSKVYYKQLCRKCQVGFNPYRVESILCKGCSQTCCSCEKKQRHINMKRPHRQDLCCRCKGMRLSCDATYSFKYIV
ncbi:protein ZAR1-like [Etheostoma spectabile]|uniref:protein ZAR1-like n=1 Tax=Etheostoma spectabile TaxID=54343 RepID=UPI0013AED208|nr:ZAR1-like protein [Etheostoma spectabile]